MHGIYNWPLVTNLLNELLLDWKKKKACVYEFPRARLFNGNLILLEYHNEKQLG